MNNKSFDYVKPLKVVKNNFLLVVSISILVVLGEHLEVFDIFENFKWLKLCYTSIHLCIMHTQFYII